MRGIWRPFSAIFPCSKGTEFSRHLEMNRHSKIHLNKVASHQNLRQRRSTKILEFKARLPQIAKLCSNLANRHHRCCQQDLQVRAATYLRGLQDWGRGAAVLFFNVWKSWSWKVWKSRSILPWIPLYLCLGPERIWMPVMRVFHVASIRCSLSKT